MSRINWEDFQKADLRAGTIIKVEKFPEAKTPAYKIWVDLGSEFGVKKSSARITELYDPDQLLHKQVVCVVNFPPKQIGPFVSEVLITGFPDVKNRVILATTERKVPNGSRLF